MIQFNCYYSSHALKIKEVENYANLLGRIRKGISRKRDRETFIQWLYQIEINVGLVFMIYNPQSCMKNAVIMNLTNAICRRKHQLEK